MFSNPDLQRLIFGRLSLESIPYQEPILLVTFAAVALGGIIVLGLVTYFRQWGYLWRELSRSGNQTEDDGDAPLQIHASVGGKRGILRLAFKVIGSA